MIFPRFLFPLGCGLLLSVTGASAQVPLPPSFTPPPPPPGLPPTLPSNLPGFPSNPGALGDDAVKVQFSNSPIGDVLDFYGRLTGKRVLTDNTVNSTSTLNFDIAKSVPKTEAVRIIETVLNLNGYSIAPGEANVIKVLGPGKNPRAVGIPIYSDPGDLPRNEQIVSYLLRLRYLDPIEIAGILQQYIPPGNTVNFTALEKAGAVIITDDASTVRKLVDLVASLDQPFAPVTEKWIRLERADAAKAIEFLNSVFDSKSASSGGSSAPGAPGGSSTATLPNGRRPIRRTDDGANPTADNPNIQVSNNGGGPITLSGDSIIQGRITLTADVRTNRVNVVTSPANMPIVEQLLEEYDADTPFATPVRRPLKFVSATDVLPILVQALSEPGSDQQRHHLHRHQLHRHEQRRSTTGLQHRPEQHQQQRHLVDGSSSPRAAAASGVGNSELNTQSVDTTPTIATVGNTKIIADQRSNTIILLGGAEAQGQGLRRPRPARRARPAGHHPHGHRRVVAEEGQELGFNYLLRTNRGSLLSSFNSGQLPGVTTTSSTSAASGIGTGTSAPLTRRRPPPRR